MAVKPITKDRDIIRKPRPRGQWDAARANEYDTLAHRQALPMGLTGNVTLRGERPYDGQADLSCGISPAG